MDSRYFTRSRRFTDKVDLHGELLNQGIVGRDFFTEVPVCQDHLTERIAEQDSAFIEISALGDNFRPLDDLTHITICKSGVFGGVAT